MSLINGDEAPFWLFPSALPADLCELLGRHARALNARPGEVGGPGDPAIRTATVAFFPQGSWVNALVDKYAWEANVLAGWHYGLSGSEPVQWSRYDRHGGYDWHVDTFLAHGTTRKLSVSVQLSEADAYEGGQIELRRHGHADGSTYELPDGARALGSVLVFPSFLMHRVSPVTAGSRTSLASWVRGPRFS